MLSAVHRKEHGGGPLSAPGVLPLQLLPEKKMQNVILII